MTFQEQYDLYRSMVEARLAEFFPGPGLEEAMRYSLLAGGKRLRPVLALAFCAAAGGDPAAALDFACGVEMVHTYSLIHDDLPCMDNDDLRRGMPTNHKRFGECVATLAGDALQAAAFQTVLSAAGDWRHSGSAAVVLAARILAEAAGAAGMCGGQYWDTLGNGSPRTAGSLTEINDKKTGALLRAACMMGVCASMGRRAVDEGCMDAARDYATNLGLAFQIRDDILDAVSTAEELGKPIGSDADNGKTTFATLYGLDKCRELVAEHPARAGQSVSGAFERPEFLCALADFLAKRKN